MMTNADYGKRVREREGFNRSASRLITGKDGKAHRMNIFRKARKGISQWRNITKQMTVTERTFIRERLHRATREAFQREWIGNNPFATIRKLVVG